MSKSSQMIKRVIDLRKHRDSIKLEFISQFRENNSLSLRLEKQMQTNASVIIWTTMKLSLLLSKEDLLASAFQVVQVKLRVCFMTVLMNKASVDSYLRRKHFFQNMNKVAQNFKTYKANLLALFLELCSKNLKHFQNYPLSTKLKFFSLFFQDKLKNKDFYQISLPLEIPPRVKVEIFILKNHNRFGFLGK